MERACVKEVTKLLSSFPLNPSPARSHFPLLTGSSLHSLWTSFFYPILHFCYNSSSFPSIFSKTDDPLPFALPFPFFHSHPHRHFFQSPLNLALFFFKFIPPNLASVSSLKFLLFPLIRTEPSPFFPILFYEHRVQTFFFIRFIILWIYKTQNKTTEIHPNCRNMDIFTASVIFITKNIKYLIISHTSIVFAFMHI